MSSPRDRRHRRIRRIRYRHRKRRWYERTRVRKAFRWLSFGTLGSLALYGAGLFVYLLFIKPDTSDHIKHAMFHESQGNISAAIVEAKQALQKEPNNGQVRWLLSGYLIRQQDGAGAREQVKRLKEMGFASKDVEFRLLEALLLERQYNEVLARLAFVTAEGRDPAVHIFRGSARLGLGRTESALEAFEAALGVDPNNLQAWLGIASAHLAVPDYRLAEKAIQQALRINPNHYQTLVLQGRLLADRTDYAGAQTVFEKALLQKPSPDDFVRVLLAEVLTKQGKLARAKEVLTPVLERGDVHKQAKVVLAKASLYEDDIAAAEDALLQTLSEHPSDPEANLLLGEIMLRNGNLASAENHLARYLESEPYGKQGLRLMAEVFFKRGMASQAIELLKRVDGIWYDADLLAQLGGAYLQTGDYAKATALLERAAELSPNGASVRLRLAVGQIVSGNVEGGLKELQTVAGLAPEYARADYVLGLIYFNQGEFDRAIEIANSLEARWPGEALHQLLKAAAYERKGDIREAWRLFEKALELEPENHIARYNMARIAWKAGEGQIAWERFNAVLAKRPDHLPSLLSLTQLALEEGQLDEGRAYLEQAKAHHPQALLVRYQLASIYRHQHRVAHALREAREAAALAPDNQAILLLLGRVQLETGNVIGAKATLTRLTHVAPHSIEARLLLAEAQRLAGDLASARDALRQAQSTFADDPRLKVAFGHLSLAEGDHNEALAIALAVQDKHPEAADGYLLAGNVHLAAKDYQAAVADFEAALERVESPSIVLQLGAAQEKAVGTDTAVNTYYRWLNGHPHDDQVRIALAQALVRSGDPSFAVKEFERVHERRPEDPRVVNNLAWLYGLVGNPQALAMAKRGYELAPNDPEILDTYGWLLLKSDEIGEALQVLRKAANLAPEDGEIRYHLAAGLARAGSGDMARRHLESILASNQRDVDPQHVQLALQNLQ